MKTTVRSFSASKLHCAVACSVGLPHVTGVASNSGVPGARIWSTSRCSSRAVVPITWSRRSCPVFWSCACAASLVRKHPRPFPAELTTQNSRVSCWTAMADSVSFAWASSAKQAPPVSVDRVSPVAPQAELILRALLDGSPGQPRQLDLDRVARQEEERLAHAERVDPIADVLQGPFHDGLRRPARCGQRQVFGFFLTKSAVVPSVF